MLLYTTFFSRRFVMHGMHVQKGATEAPRTPFRACKISNLLMPPETPLTIHIMGPTFCISPGPLQSSGGPGCFLSFPDQSLITQFSE